MNKTGHPLPADWSGKPYRPAVLAAVQAVAPQRVLDIACGGGWLGKALGAGVVTDGIDAYASAPEGYGSFFPDDINQALPDSVPGGYDAIVCCEAIAYLDSPALLMREAWRRLRPGGVLVLSSPNPAYAGARLYYLLRGYLPGFSHFARNRERESHMPWIALGWPQFWLLLGLSGFGEIRLCEVDEPKPKHWYERLLGWPAILYARRRARRAESPDERQFWESFASAQANYGRRLVVTARR